MEENRSAGELLDGVEDLLVRRCLHRPMQKLTVQMEALATQLPGGKVFSSGMTAAARRQIKAWILAACGILLSLFFVLAGFLWGLVAAAGCIAAAIFMGVSACFLRQKTLIVLYNDHEIRLFHFNKEEVARISYALLEAAHVHEDRLALCTKDARWILTAGESENLQLMQSFIDMLAKQRPGAVFNDDPTTETETFFED